MEKIRILCYGDSNTFGWDPRFFSGNHYDHPWPELLGEMTGFQVVNCGEPGRMVPRLESELNWFRRDVMTKGLGVSGAPDLLVIMLGTNDLFYTMDPTAGAVAERMEAMVRYAIRNALAKNILLLSCPHVTIPEEGYMEALEGISDLYRRIAEAEHVFFADPFRWDIPMAYDGVHFTEEGHRVFAEKIREEINRLI